MSAMTAMRRWRVEACIGLALFAASAGWSGHFWKTWTARGGQPSFYQWYFEPAVMIACGKGFVISKVQPKPLEDFLFLKADSFDCAQLPPDSELSTEHLYQGALLYLELTVGWSWRLLGISWSGMAPLFGALFGAVIVLAYAVCRLSMAAPFALGAAASLAVSSIHLLNLPHLRDYAKAPFMMALVFIIGLIVTRPVRARTLLALAAAYGLVLGIGYGFRTDFLAAVPVLIVVVFGFLDGGLARNLRLKAAASALFLATFAVVSWPIMSVVLQKGGCQWHVALLGLQSPFDEHLHVAPAPYDFGHAYSDEYVSRLVSGYAGRMTPELLPLGYCSHEYDVSSGALFFGIVRSFPGDILTRAAASAVQIVELPFRRWSPPMDNWYPSFYRLRSFALQPGVRWGAYFTLAAWFIITATNVRLGLFLLFFLAYFGGYPAIQFQERHYFHLEFIGWWAMAFVAYRVAVAAWSLRQTSIDWPRVRSRAASAGVVAAGIACLFAAVLASARWYQVRGAREMFAEYIAAAKAPMANPGEPLADIASTDWPQFLEVVFNRPACGANAAVTARYAATPAVSDFTRTIPIPPQSAVAGETRVFLPVFQEFQGLEFADAPPGCLVSASRFIDRKKVPLLLGATLPPDWVARPLYQRFADWGRP